MTDTARIRLAETPRQPATRHRPVLLAATAATCLAGVAIIWTGAALGLWFLPFAAGTLAGLLGRIAGLRAGQASAAASVMALGGWGLPLAWLALADEPVGASAGVVAALAGLPDDPAVVIVLTLAVALLQALAGTWLGRGLAGLALLWPGGRGRPK